jgi:hypothetical protein
MVKESSNKLPELLDYTDFITISQIIFFDLICVIDV